MNIEIRCCCSGELKGFYNMQEPCLNSPVILGGLRFTYAELHNGERRIKALKSKHYSEADLRAIPGYKPATFEQRVRDAEELLG